MPGGERRLPLRSNDTFGRGYGVMGVFFLCGVALERLGLGYGRPLDWVAVLQQQTGRGWPFGAGALVVIKEGLKVSEILRYLTWKICLCH